MKNTILGILLLGLGGALVSQKGMANENFPPLEAVSQLDLQKYLGKWYEVGSIRQRFQKGCVATTATYSLRNDGKIDVLNECRKNALDGPIDRAHGKAWVPNPSEPAKLLVQFFWPFRGDYWVIELGDNYEYAVVGHPSRNYLWILSRTPHMQSDLYDAIIERLRRVGYDVSRILATPQPE